jgi:hypothetical protein
LIYSIAGWYFDLDEVYSPKYLFVEVFPLPYHRKSMVLHGGGNLKARLKMSRYALARRLHYMAWQISAGKPARLGGKSIHVPDPVIVEEEFESAAGEADRAASRADCKTPSPIYLSAVRAQQELK